MRPLHFTTRHATAKTVERKWLLVDATNQALGRVASRVAHLLRGKHKPYYTPHIDCGDYIVIIHADKITLSGNKMEDKKYIRFTGYPGGKKEEQAKHLLVRRPEALLERAVKGMLPKNTLGRAMYRKLFVYAGEHHPHQAQNPSPLSFNKK